MQILIQLTSDLVFSGIVLIVLGSVLRQFPTGTMLDKFHLVLKAVGAILLFLGFFLGIITFLMIGGLWAKNNSQIALMAIASFFVLFLVIELISRLWRRKDR